MKYLAAFTLMLLCNEVLSLIALILMVCFFIGDILKARCAR